MSEDPNPSFSNTYCVLVFLSWPVLLYSAEIFIANRLVFPTLRDTSLPRHQAPSLPLEEISALLCLLQHCSQLPRFGRNLCPSTDDWIFKMWYTYTMEYYSTIKKKEILSSAKTWMELEVIMLSKISQAQEDKHCMIPHICEI